MPDQLLLEVQDSCWLVLELAQVGSVHKGLLMTVKSDVFLEAGLLFLNILNNNNKNPECIVWLVGFLNGSTFCEPVQSKGWPAGWCCPPVLRRSPLLVSTSNAHQHILLFYFPGSGFIMCSGKENPDSDADLDVDGDDTLEYGKPQYRFWKAYNWEGTSRSIFS